VRDGHRGEVKIRQEAEVGTCFLVNRWRAPARIGGAVLTFHGAWIMKLVRFGNPGEERPVVVDHHDALSLAAEMSAARLCFVLAGAGHRQTGRAFSSTRYPGEVPRVSASSSGIRADQPFDVLEFGVDPPSASVERTI
jgi:hypothetical protein